MPITVPQEIKDQIKQQRLLNLSISWYSCQLDKVAYEARGEAENVAKAEEELLKIEAAYAAIEAHDEEEVIE